MKLLILLLTLTITAVPGAQIRLSWNPNPETDISHYEVEVTGDALRSVMASGTNATVDLNAGDYTFAVRAVNLAGLESELSDPITYTVTDGPRVTASSEAPAYPVSNAADGDTATLYASFYQPQPQDPQWIELDLGSEKWIKGIRYLPRQDGYLPSGHLTGYQIFADGRRISEGGIATIDAAEKVILFPKTLARFWRLQSTLTHLTCAEFAVIETTQPMMRFSFQYGTDLKGWEDLPSFDRPKREAGFVRWKIEEIP